MTFEVDYPETKKLKEVQDKSQAIHEFFEFLGEKKLFLAEYVDPLTSESIYPAHVMLTDLVAEFFEIDQVKLEQEKRKLLDEIRKAHES